MNSPSSSTQGEETCHLIHLSYMADGPDDTPIAVRAACKLCGQAWEFVGTTEDVKDYDRQLTAANERADRYKAALEKAHDELDERNNEAGYCLACPASGYDANGLRHDDDCVLVEIRQLLNPIPTSDTGENGQGA